jgi:hypothetical protein
MKFICIAATCVSALRGVPAFGWAAGRKTDDQVLPRVAAALA